MMETLRILRESGHWDVIKRHTAFSTMVPVLAMDIQMINVKETLDGHAAEKRGGPEAAGFVGG